MTVIRWAPARPRAARGRRRWPSVALITGLAALGGCASLRPDGGFAPIEQTARDRLGKDLRWARSDADQDGIAQRVSQLLAQPLTVDDAVQLALLNNRGLQAAFQDLGLAEADVVQAGRLPKPGFSFGRLARAEAVYRQTLDRAAETAVNARSEVREAYTAYRSAHDIARHHRDEIR